MYHYRTYLVYGSLKPRHAAGTIVGALQCDRYYSGAWHRTRTYTVRASNFYGYSRYKSYIVSLPTAGRWRVRAYHSATSSSEAGYSSWYYVTVR
jgi:hypothetical protein